MNGIPAGYKQTEAGVIPEDWESISAVDACSKIQDGTHFSPRIRGNDYFYVTSKNIRFGYLDMSTASRIDATQHHAIYRRCDVKLGDVLLTKDGANTGNAALNTLTDEFSLLSSVAFLRFQQGNHCGAYFLQQILATHGQRQIQEAMAGNAITRLTLEKINKLRFPVPPTKAEQEAIAEALGDADALIESLEQLLTKNRHLKQASMQELLSGKKRLPGFGGEWEARTIDSFSAFVTKGATPTTYGYNWQDDGVLFLRSECVSADGLDLSQSMFISHAAHATLNRGEVKEGDLLMTITGNVGRVVSLPADFGVANINQHIARIRIKAADVSSEFVFHFLSQAEIRAKYALITTGQAYPQISLKQVRETLVPLPGFSEQTAIAVMLSDMDAEISDLEAQLTKTRAVKHGMMQKLLTGEIRLI